MTALSRSLFEGNLAGLRQYSKSDFDDWKGTEPVNRRKTKHPIAHKSTAEGSEELPVPNPRSSGAMYGLVPAGFPSVVPARPKSAILTHQVGDGRTTRTFCDEASAGLPFDHELNSNR